jgi:cellulose biosynthesis protein BcsQ
VNGDEGERQYCSDTKSFSQVKAAKMIITVTNQKGGSGKTSTTVLIALALASVNKRVLCVDCDPQGGLTSFLYPDSEVSESLFDILTGGSFAPLKIVRHSLEFYLIPADHRLDKIYSTLRPFELEKAFGKAGYDYIIFDTPPTVQGISLSASIIADKVFIPADISRATMKSTLYTLETLRDIKKNGDVILIGYKEPAPESTSFTSNVARDFTEAIGNHCIGTIKKSVAMQRAISDAGLRWTDKRRQEILQPILELLGVKYG